MTHRIIGIGNEFRSDDGIGLYVAREIKKQYPHLNVFESDGDGVELISHFQKCDLLILIDAAYTNKFEDVGKIIQLNASDFDKISNIHFVSSHNFGLVEALKMGKTLKILPDDLYLYVILAKNFDYGTGISEQLKESIEKIISLIIKNHFH
ncbi:MAG: hydrogenase maturation protease [Ignavibacteria bacterium]|nr:hydrogenase maturation protease [Ignavibacteria bacterium]